MQRSMGVKDCRVRISKMRQLMGCGMGTRKLGIFLVWVNGWRRVVELKTENDKEQMLEEGVHFACKYGLVWVKI